jgi:hypothetical protein
VSRGRPTANRTARERQQHERDLVIKPHPRVSAQRPSRASTPRASLGTGPRAPAPAWASYAYEFQIGREVPTALARAAKRLATPGGPITTAQLWELRRVARQNGRPDDQLSMFLAGLLDSENVRVLARTPIRPGAMIGFSLGSIQAGMPQVRALGRRRRGALTATQTREAAVWRAPAPPTVQGRSESASLKEFQEKPSEVGHWRDTIAGELDSWVTDENVIVGAFTEAARAGKFVQLQDHVNMARVFKQLNPFQAVDVGMLGPVASGRAELTERRVEYIAKMTGDIGPICAEVFVHRMVASMYTDDTVDLIRGLQANARIKTTIALMPAVQDLLRRKGIMVEAWSDREGKGSDFWRSAWESVKRNAYPGLKDPIYMTKWQQLPPDYKAWADAAQEEAIHEALSASNVAKGVVDYMTFGWSSVLTGLAIDTPKGAYHLMTGEYEQAGPELVGLMIMAGTWGVGKGIKVLGNRAAGVETAEILDYSGPKSKALAKVEAILNANPSAKAAAASLASLSETEIEAGGRYVTGNAASAAFVYRGGPRALRALIEARGDLGVAEAKLRARSAPAQLAAGAEEVSGGQTTPADAEPSGTAAAPDDGTAPPGSTPPAPVPAPEAAKPAAASLPEPKPQSKPRKALRSYIPEAGPEFSEWFDSLTLEELDEFLADAGARKAIARKIRHPGTYHEWLMVAEARRFKQWHVSMRTVLTARTRTGATIGTGFRHGGKGSTTFHTMLLGMIRSSRSYNDFLMKLNLWADDNLSPSFSERWPFDVRRGRYSLPSELQIPGEGARGGNR